MMEYSVVSIPMYTVCLIKLAKWYFLLTLTVSMCMYGDPVSLLESVALLSWGGMFICLVKRIVHWIKAQTMLQSSGKTSEKSPPQHLQMSAPVTTRVSC